LLLIRGILAALRQVFHLSGCPNLADQLTVPDTITLLPLPPYSPELNPMENVWDYLRGNKLSHRVWDTYEAILEACAEAWRFLMADPKRIRSIATRSWAWVNG
jgi:hypothetical protein